MADIAITDKTGLTADLKIRDDSAFGKAKPTKLILVTASLVREFTSPIDQTNFSKGKFGATFAEPSSLVGGAATLGLNASVSGALTVLRSTDETLFPDDGMSPAIPIGTGE